MNRRQMIGLALPLIAAPSLVLAQAAPAATPAAATADPYQPVEVPIREGFEVGSIVVVSDKFFLYHVIAPGRAIRHARPHLPARPQCHAIRDRAHAAMGAGISAGRSA